MPATFNSAGKTSSYRGVTWDKAKNKWRASITIAGKPKVLGTFGNEREAAKKYDAAARKRKDQSMAGLLNFPSAKEKGTSSGTVRAAARSRARRLLHRRCCCCCRCCCRCPPPPVPPPAPSAADPGACAREERREVEQVPRRVLEQGLAQGERPTGCWCWCWCWWAADPRPFLLPLVSGRLLSTLTAAAPTWALTRTKR